MISKKHCYVNIRVTGSNTTNSDGKLKFKKNYKKIIVKMSKLQATYVTKLSYEIVHIFVTDIFKCNHQPNQYHTNSWRKQQKHDSIEYLMI